MTHQGKPEGIERHVELMLQGCRYDGRTIAARLRWIRDVESRGPKDAESIVRSFGATAEELTAEARKQWKAHREANR
jgi:hypothetical protein